MQVALMGVDVLWGDPMFTDATAHDFTLKDSSAAYHISNDGSVAAGNLKWATSTNIAVYNALNLAIDGPGFVELDPKPNAKFYVPSTVVTLTAIPDTLGELVAWGGDLSGSDLSATLTMDADNIYINVTNN